MQNPDPSAPTTEQDLDKALQATFPASDPPAATAHLTATPTADSVAAGERSADHPGTVTIYRVVGEDQIDKPFAANGGATHRWTSEGTPAVYAATSPATALLEFLAHCEGVPPRNAWMASANIPRNRITVLQAYPSTWRERPYRHEVQCVGDEWATSHKSLAAEVPSAICEGTHNILLNPEHVDVPLLQGVHVAPMTIDDRLRRLAGA